MKLKRGFALILAFIIAFCMVLTACDLTDLSDPDDGDDKVAAADKDKDTSKKTDKQTDADSDSESDTENKVTIDNIPEYSGKAYIVINNNQPEFADDDITTKTYEFYSPLDSKGRCGYVMACLGRETMPAPNEERKSITHVYPSGWKTADDKSNNNQYDAKVVPGGYIYNRCHLIGWQLSAENANKSNLITGTQYFNIEGMLPFENQIAAYIKETGNHVMYRVTPIYGGDDLLAKGIHLEAYSVEDEGEGICDSVYIYNVQPGIEIDYTTGANKLGTSGAPAQTEATTQTEETTKNSDTAEFKYILNTDSKKIHAPTCRYADNKYKEETNKSISELEAEGYTKCGTCKKDIILD